MNDGELEFLREFEVALVVSRNGHDGSAAVSHHNVVRDPDGDLLAVYRVDGKGSGRDTGFFLVEATLHVGLAGASGDVGFNCFLLLVSGDLGNQRVLGSEDHVGRSEEGIGSSGEDGDVVTFDIEDHFGAFTATDPVALEGLDRLGPIEGFQFIDETLGVFRNAKHPLTERTTFHCFAFRFPFFDFLIGKHGAHGRRPVHRRFVDESEAHFVDLLRRPTFRFQFGNRLGLLVFFAEVGVVELEENPLRPADIVGVGGIDFAIPIVAEPESLELSAKVVDVGLGGDARVLAGLDGVLLGGQTEGVPAHGVQDVEAIHALVAAYDVSRGVTLRVADVQAGATRVREHVEDVVFRLGGIKAFLARPRSPVGLVLGPMGLPLGFELVEGVGLAFFGHGFLGGRETIQDGKNTQKMKRV